jgi:hypothetical protein
MIFFATRWLVSKFAKSARKSICILTITLCIYSWAVALWKTVRLFTLDAEPYELFKCAHTVKGDEAACLWKMRGFVLEHLHRCYREYRLNSGFSI